MHVLRGAVLCVAGLAAAFVPVTAAQEEEQEFRQIKVPAKHYKALAAQDVYSAVGWAAERGGRVRPNVEFRDAFDRVVRLEAAERTRVLGGRRYTVAFAFRTSADLICLVPRSSPRALRTLFGLPPDGPMPAPDRLPRPVVQAGQTLTVRGTIAGQRGVDRYILVDSVFLGEGGRPPGSRQVRVFLPGEGEPHIVDQRGQRSWSFACSHGETEQEQLAVSIQPKSPQQVANEVARLAGQLEGLSEGPKTYGQYSAAAVYRYAGRGGERINVDFTDKVKDLIPNLAAEGLQSAPAVRGGRITRVGVDVAFETTGGVTCLVSRVPAWPTVFRQATQLLPGQRVRIRGTTIGPSGPNNRVLVDYLSFPDRPAEERDTWWVRVDLGANGARRLLWDYGYYQFGVPRCRTGGGRYQSPAVLLEKYWVRRVRTGAAPEEAGGEEE